jgi:hypothetical protein
LDLEAVIDDDLSTDRDGLDGASPHYFLFVQHFAEERQNFVFCSEAE